MKHFYIALTLAASVLASGCSDDVVSSLDGNTVIRAGADELSAPASRTCVDHSTIGTGAVNILWTPGDTLAVYGSASSKCVPFTTSITSSKSTAPFAGNLATGETPVYAVYPFSKNMGTDVTALKGTLPQVQKFNLATGQLQADYKVGVPKAASSATGEYQFSFTHLFSILKFDISATGTDLVGEKLEKIVLTVNSSGTTKCVLAGSFTFDASSLAYTFTSTTEDSNSITMDWTDRPALTSGRTYTGFITCAPDVKAGDVIEVKIETTDKVASFRATSKVDFAANGAYNFPLDLQNWATEANGWKVTPKENAYITDFSFTAAANPGKILTKELYRSNGATKQRSISSPDVTATIDNDARTISAEYVHLSDRTLVPTFKATVGAKVYVNDVEQESGVSAVNFSKPVTYVVESISGQKTSYTVSITGTGLPVLVVNHSENDPNATYVDWTQTGLKVHSKDADWLANTTLTLYNADGSLEGSYEKAAIRLRGNSSQSFPKKPFAIKLEKKANLLNIGAGKHKRWVLLANWKDRTLLRNALALGAAKEIRASHTDGMEWSPSGRSVEVIYNGVHLGNYFLCEQIKVDPGNRAGAYPAPDGEKAGEYPTDDASMANYSYLLEMDDGYDETCKFVSNFYLPIQFKDHPGEYALGKIRDRIRTMETKLYSGNFTDAFKDLDLPSAIDYFILQELAMNGEAMHPKSCYILIDGVGKIKHSAVWDFDWQTWPNYSTLKSWGILSQYKLPELDYNKSMLASYTGKQYYNANHRYVNATKKDELPSLMKNPDKPYMWFPALMKSSEFKSTAITRWNAMKSRLETYANQIDVMAAEIKASEAYNWTIWPISTSQADRNWDWFTEGYIGDENMDFDTAIQTLKSNYLKRVSGLNTFITSSSYPSISFTEQQSPSLIEIPLS